MDIKFKDTLGKNIRYFRNERNLTQSELAKKIKKGDSTVRMWELGKSQPDIETLQKLSKVLKVSVDQLFYDYDNPENNKKDDSKGTSYKYIRDSFGLSLSDLAKLINETEDKIIAIESDQKLPTLKYTEKMVNLANLLQHSDKIYDKPLDSDFITEKIDDLVEITYHKTSSMSPQKIKVLKSVYKSLSED